LITCSRCGKENQDHYKFCLGCGNELPKPASAPAPAAQGGAGGNAELETARTVLPPGPVGGLAIPAAMAMTAAAGELRPPTVGANKAKGGIPWGDSPKVPAAVPFQLPPNPLAGPAPARATGSIGTPNSPRVTSAPAPAPAPAPSSNEIPCPTCGRPVQIGFAFCGACGTRVAAPPAGGAAAPAAARPPGTMFMGASPAAAPSAAPRGRLILIRPDGSEGGSHPLHDGDNLIGRGQAALFDADAYLSPRHAELSVGQDGVTVRDLQSLNGVFLKITSEEVLDSGDIFRIGQELLRFEVISPPQALEDGTEVMGTPNPGFWGRLSVIVGRDVDGSAFPLFGEAIVLGRERGDILFPEDGYVSGTHARIALRDEHVYLTDLGSSNGTFLRLRHERTVPTGSFMLMGQQLFRLEFR
jgi:pSer/pThr/pTyr-binding forkhead associated (FHA) protein